MIGTSEVWSPHANDWFKATIKHLSGLFSHKIFFATLGNGETVAVSTSKVTFAPYSHICQFRIGDEIYVRLERYSTAHADYQALECRVECYDTEPRNESGVVVKWCGNYGTVRRGCGCQVLALTRESFYEGEQVEFEVICDKTGRHGYVASRVHSMTQTIFN